ncbi:hypothetical protein J1N35_015333 [Gossypium stocksii]|uniref:Uncharacterized protein n=1 Tax=Gossypium stocksii TaxID=47602 RepID=A0A9D3VW37_9ROSI|nr:hypothetical protein J1N35_015333 [Gossypium stocksii]
MNSKGKRDCKESFASPGDVFILELDVNASLLTMGSDNLELGTEALTRVVREVLEDVLEVRIMEISGTFQSSGVLRSDYMSKLNQVCTPTAQKMGFGESRKAFC